MERERRQRRALTSMPLDQLGHGTLTRTGWPCEVPRRIGLIDVVWEITLVKAPGGAWEKGMELGMIVFVGRASRKHCECSESQVNKSRGDAARHHWKSTTTEGTVDLVCWRTLFLFVLFCLLFI